MGKGREKGWEKRWEKGGVNLGWGERMREQRTKAAASTTASLVEERWWMAAGMTPVVRIFSHKSP